MDCIVLVSAVSFPHQKASHSILSRVRSRIVHRTGLSFDGRFDTGASKRNQSFSRDPMGMHPLKAQFFSDFLNSSYVYE